MYTSPASHISLWPLIMKVLISKYLPNSLLAIWVCTSVPKKDYICFHAHVLWGYVLFSIIVLLESIGGWLIAFCVIIEFFEVGRMWSWNLKISKQGPKGLDYIFPVRILNFEIHQCVFIMSEEWLQKWNTPWRHRF